MNCHYCTEDIQGAAHTWNEGGQELCSHVSCWKRTSNHTFVLLDPLGAMWIEQHGNDTLARRSCVKSGATRAFRNNQGQPFQVYPQVSP